MVGPDCIILWILSARWMTDMLYFQEDEKPNDFNQNQSAADGFSTCGKDPAVGDCVSDPNNPLDWVAYAEEDFDVAKILLKKSRPLISPSCFHSQQCAEKYLKAMLIYKNVEFPKTQDLLALETFCNNAGILTKFAQDGLDKLSDYTAHAYEPPDFQITSEDAREALEIATEVRRFARTYLGLKK